MPRIGYFLDVIGQRKVFSVLDAARINAIYDCPDPLRKSFNCNFNLMNICGFVNEPDEEQSKWTQYDVYDGQNIGGTFDGKFLHKSAFLKPFRAPLNGKTWEIRSKNVQLIGMSGIDAYKIDQNR